MTHYPVESTELMPEDFYERVFTHGYETYFKNKPDVVALEDSEYPEWLWGLLEEFESKANDKSGGVDPKSMDIKSFPCYICIPFLNMLGKTFANSYTAKQH